MRAAGQPGVCLIFENSTVCLIVDGISLFVFGNLDSELTFGVCFVGVLFFIVFSMESLILAQDERWRRA